MDQEVHMPEIRRADRSRPAQAVITEFQRAARATSSGDAAPVRSDSAGITGEARDLARALSAVESAPDVRAEKVQALRAQVERGTYRPNPRDVAEKILERGL
jgi:negative regulator of flagellin synthesis FlgM